MSFCWVDIGERIWVSDGPSSGMGTSGLVDIGERIRVSGGPSSGMGTSGLKPSLRLPVN